MLTLSGQDRDRLNTLKQVHEEVLSAAEGARRLGLSARHFRRLRRRWELEGDVTVIHRARGRPPNSQLAPPLRQRALEMARDPLYEDFGPTLLAEHLERDPLGGRVHPSMLRLWLITEGLWQPERRRARHRKRRPRRRARGELVLMDSSEHDWLEGRGAEELSLVAMGSTMPPASCSRASIPATRGWPTGRCLPATCRRTAVWRRCTWTAGHFGNWRRPSVPTTYQSQEAERRVHAAGGVYLVKPLQPRATYRMIRDVMTVRSDGWRRAPASRRTETVLQ